MAKPEPELGLLRRTSQGLATGSLTWTCALHKGVMGEGTALRRQRRMCLCRSLKCKQVMSDQLEPCYPGPKIAKIKPFL